MDKLDVLYRAFKKYRSYTKDDNALLKERKPIEQKDESDVFWVKKYLCHVDEIWLKNIEAGLPFIEKALAEERQFIRTDSEVVDIEKVKRVGRESVEHLAKHSELITREQKDNDLVPDKILMVEKESDYAVYENRFLYMLLCYLRDFIYLRYQKISELLACYDAEFNLVKKISLSKEEYEFATHFKVSRKNNPYPLTDDLGREILERIKNCEQWVNALLNRPLIIEVAKSPMIKPPIVKTNVLKNNNNFKKAVVLYEFVANYNVDGFTVEEVKRDLLPLDNVKASEIAELYSLTSFLTYEYGNDLTNMLEARYQEEEKRLAQLKEEETKRQIQVLKKKIADGGGDVYAYMLLLEKRNNDLEKQLIELPILEKTIKQQKEQINTLLTDNANLEQEKEDLNKQISDLMVTHQQEVKELNIKHNDEINMLEEKFTKENEKLQVKYDTDVSNLESMVDNLNKENTTLKNNYAQYKTKLDNEKTDYQIKLAKEYEDKKNKLEADIVIAKEHLKSGEDLLAEKEAAFKELELLRKAEYAALMLEQHKSSQDYTNKEKFNELEETYLTLSKFFASNWQKTKKSIRKRVLWAKKQSKRSDE